MSNIILGGCVCGSVKYEVRDDFDYVGFCHCKDCRKASGTAFASFGGIKKSLLKLTQGKSEIGRFELSENTSLCFCIKCGAQLYGDKPKSNLVHIRLGTLDEFPSKKPQLHVYVDSKVDWYEITDDLPRFGKLPPEK